MRDAPWNTVPGTVREQSISQRSTDFVVFIRQDHRLDDLDVECELEFTGRASGELSIRATTHARSALRYSKMGLNLHHGLRTYRGAAYRAHTLDGWHCGELGEAIEPQLIRGDTLTAMFAHFDALDVDLPGVTVSFAFAGDRFEMQDHRNWSDANWKTYGTPLEYGFPMDCAAGQRFEQTVTVRVSHEADAETAPVRERPAGPMPSNADVVRIELGESDGRLPEIGVDASADRASDHLATIGVAFARVAIDVENAGDNASQRWRSLVESAMPVEAVVHIADEPGSARAAVDALVASGINVRRIVCLPRIGGAFSAFRGATPPELVIQLMDALASSPLRGSPLFSGASQSYNVIARDRPDYPGDVGIIFAGSPQIHASDDRSLMENAGAFGEMVRDCHRLYPDRAVVLSPVHLISEDGPFPNGPPASPGDRPWDDPRYDTPFAASWSVAMLAAIARQRADAVCLFDAFGARGVLAADGTPKPSATVLSALAGRAGHPTRSADVSHPDDVAVLDVGEDADRRVVVANLTDERQLVHVGWADAPPTIETWIDDASPTDRSQPGEVRTMDGVVLLPLQPYAVVVVGPATPGS
ncbi:hypothetical protein BH24ACT5_BH24ACT5_13270 [soil metagenome]